MKQREFAFNAQTNGSGVLMMANKAEMERFFKQWPNAKLVFTCRVLPEDIQRAMIGFYKYSIFPVFKSCYYAAGNRMTDPEIDLELRSLSPVMRVELPEEETDGFDLVKIRSLASCGSDELTEFFRHLEQIGAEIFGIEKEWSTYLR